jgi:thymidylate synthase ThyX
VTAADRELTEEERARVAPYVTSVDGPVFALTNLPEATKGALFARYSRSPKSLRWLLIDEFLTPPPDEGVDPARGSTEQGCGSPDEGGPEPSSPGRPLTGRAGSSGGEVGAARAEALYGRVLAEYGDDSVAQLGAAHLAVEGASNLLTKAIEWGRLGSYLEQSTRYIPFTDRPGGRYRYHRPVWRAGEAALARRYEEILDCAFETYGALLPRLEAWIDRQLPVDGEAGAARARAVRARALDALRGLLPAATTANVGVFASGQAWEAMLIRLRAHPLPEARQCGERMLVELRKVIPAFLTRVDREDRGVAHSRYLGEVDRAAAVAAERLLGDPPRGPDGPAVRLVDHDPDGEARVVAHALWPGSGRSLAEVRAAAEAMSPPERARVLEACAGRRGDRRQRPGRAFEATTYAFEVVADYGAYRDLQRHRMLSLQAQPLTPWLGYEVPLEVAEAGAAPDYEAAQAACVDLYDALAAVRPHEAAYAVTLAHRVRFTMVMNAREAMHVIELRSQPQGHESYRRVAREMHRLIAQRAGHEAIASAMTFVDDSDPVAGRLGAERAAEARRRALH